MYVHVYVYTNILSSNLNVYIPKCACMYKYTYVIICKCVCTFAFAFVSVNVSDYVLYMYIYIYIFKCIYTCMPVYLYMHALGLPSTAQVPGSSHRFWVATLRLFWATGFGFECRWHVGFCLKLTECVCVWNRSCVFRRGKLGWKNLFKEVIGPVVKVVM